MRGHVITYSHTEQEGTILSVSNEVFHFVLDEFHDLRLPTNGDPVEFDAHRNSETIYTATGIRLLRPMSPNEVEQLKQLRVLFENLGRPIGERGEGSVFSGAVFDIDTQITRRIRGLGIPTHLKGYHYLRKAVHIVIDDLDRDRIPHIQRAVYPWVAEEYSTTPVKVERCIRHAVHIAWNRNHAKVRQLIHGAESSIEPPTSGEMITALAEEYRLSRIT